MVWNKNYSTEVPKFLKCLSIHTSTHTSTYTQYTHKHTHPHTHTHKHVHTCCVLSCVGLFAIPWTVAKGSSVHGILQARILEWVAIHSSRGSYRPRDQTDISYIQWIGRQILYHQHHLGRPPRMPWRRKWQLAPVFCLGNPVDREDWWVHGITESWTWLSDLSSTHIPINTHTHSQFRKNCKFTKHE